MTSDIGGRRSHAVEGARRAIEQREAVPGQPSEGPYPASVDEVAEELARFVDELDATCAPGVLVSLAVKLAKLSARDPRRDWVSGYGRAGLESDSGER